MSKSMIATRAISGKAVPGAKADPLRVRLRRAGTLFAAMACVFLSAPGTVSAQGFSDGYKFLEAVKKKEGEEVEQALMANPGIVLARDVTSGETALHIVTQRRDLTWLRYLIGKGANVNEQDDKGRAPLELAVNLGWGEGVDVLLAKDARPDLSNDAGETPLIYAVHRNDSQMAKALLQAGADADRADNSGRSARDYAEIRGGRILTVIETYAKETGGNSKPVYGPTF